MLNVAMLSKWHVHAEGYANELLKSGKVNIKAVWDDDCERGKAWAEKLGVEFYPCLDELLKRDDIEAVICDIATTKHCEPIIKAANAKKHIFTEKALAPTLAECELIKEAVVRNGVTFVISYPMRGTGIIQFAKKMIAEGAFGKLNYVRIRNGHNGVSGNWLPAYWYNKEETAGGAMMDLGCHPVYTLAYLCGKPKRITGMFTAPMGSKIDENAVAIAEFNDGIIGVGETSFIVYGAPEVIELYGTEGCLICVGGDVKFRSTKIAPYIDGFISPSLPRPKPIPLLQFVDACINGTGSPEGLGIDDALALTELLENAYIGDSTNTIVVR